MPSRIPVEPRRVRAFCDKWRVKEFSLFGSVLRDDFSPTSDVDVLVELKPGHGLGLYDWVQMRDELASMFGRPVDLLSANGLRNPFRRHAILSTREVLYAA